MYIVRDAYILYTMKLYAIYSRIMLIANEEYAKIIFEKHPETELEVVIYLSPPKLWMKKRYADIYMNVFVLSVSKIRDHCKKENDKDGKNYQVQSHLRRNPHSHY